MKILFVQFSDMHCNGKDFRLNKIDKAIAALKTLGTVDQAVLIFSGDLADTASPNEFKMGRKALGCLLSRIGKIVNSWVPLLIVPGNHDMVLPDDSRGIEEITNWSKNNVLDDHLDEELDKLDDFFKYAYSKGCFTKSNRLYHIKNISLKDINIRFCLLNSAPFSTRQPFDKQSHYFPKAVEEKLIQDTTADLKITVIHHGYEWFDWSSKVMLKTHFSNEDIVFFGHDHSADTLTIQDAKGANTNIVAGGMFSLNYSDDAAFNAVIYDSETKEFASHQFNWIKEHGLFSEAYSKEIILNSQTFSLIPLEQYLDNFLEDKQLAVKLIDYYVFPKLVPEHKGFDSQCSELIDEDSFFDSLLQNKAIKISGRANSGKSALIKYIYYVSINKGFSPLLIEKKHYDSRIEKMFRDMFELQYGDKEFGFDRFMQLDFNKRIIFVDDFDEITNERAGYSLLDYILSRGGLLVYTVNEDTQSLENIVREKLKAEHINAFQIAPFLTEKREELVLKVSSLEKYKKAEQAQNIIMALNYLVQVQASFFTLTPGNLLEYIKYYLSDGMQEAAGAKTLSLVFETNIRNSILACISSFDAVIYLSALEYIASTMYFELQKEEIEVQQLEETISKFNNRKRTNLKCKVFFDSCQKAKILDYADSSFNISFCDKNTFAYFIARYVSSELGRTQSSQEKASSIMDKVSYIMNHICFGINDAIVLFLSYIQNSSSIILRIASTANNILEKYPELNFDDQNIPFLTTYRSLDLPMPSAVEVKKHKNEISKIEESRHEAVKFRGIFDYDESDVEKEKYRVLRALKYTRLIGQALVDQYGTLESEELESMITSIYSNTQKVLYAVMKPYQDQYDKIISSLISFAKEVLPDKEIKSEEIHRLLTDSAVILSLNVMNDIAYTCSNSRTISVLREMEAVTSNYSIHKLIMVENTGNTPAFVKDALSLNQQYNKNPFIRSLISQIARKHIIFMSKIDNKQINKLVSGKILSVKNSKGLLIQHKQHIDERSTK